MKKIISVCTLIIFTLVSMSVTVEAGATKGQKIFKKKFRKKCGFSGVRFARYHTQGEWEDVYEFSYMYAKDGKVPKC